MKTAYRLFLTVVFLALMLEAGGTPLDPVARLGADFHSDLTNVIHVHVIVSIFEILVLLTVICWLFRGKRAAKAVRFSAGTLMVPILVFVGMLVFGVLYGQLRGGATFTEALWEVRGFLMMIVGYLLIGMFVQTERESNNLTWTLLLAPAALALENTYRAFAYKSAIDGSDLAYDHTDSVVIGCAILLCVAIITYGGTRWQRRFAFAALPVLTVCLLLMKRRAAFPVVGIGIVVLLIFLLRLRPRLFWRYVPPVVLLIALYLAAFWTNTGTLGQPARAISSQFTPDPRDYASNLYRDIEKADLLANIQQAPITGLGFGQPFTFYYQLPNLSFWPFWHYETHNAVLWVWMKDGAIGFLAFFWLLGRGIYDGSSVVETQREEWALVAELRKRFSRRHAQEVLLHPHPTGAHQVMYRQTGAPRRKVRGERRSAQTVGLNVPTWERSDDKRSATLQRSSALALLVVAVCMIPMQMVYSYVDLGLTSERDMLVLGLMLGLIARGQSLLMISNGMKSNGKRSKGIHAEEADLAPVQANLESVAKAHAPRTQMRSQALKLQSAASSSYSRASLRVAPTRTSSSDDISDENRQNEGSVDLASEWPLPWET